MRIIREYNVNNNALTIMTPLHGQYRSPVNILKMFQRNVHVPRTSIRLPPPLRRFFAVWERIISFSTQLAVLCVTVVSVIGDLPPGTRRNTYLPPETTQSGYQYTRPSVPFPTRPSPTFPTRPSPTFPTRPSPTYPTRPSPTYPVPTRPSPTYPVPGTRPTTGTFPTRPSTGFPPSTGYPTRPRPTPGFPDYTSQPSGPDGNSIGIGVSTGMKIISKIDDNHLI